MNHHFETNHYTQIKLLRFGLSIFTVFPLTNVISRCCICDWHYPCRPQRNYLQNGIGIFELFIFRVSTFVRYSPELYCQSKYPKWWVCHPATQKRNVYRERMNKIVYDLCFDWFSINFILEKLNFYCGISSQKCHLESSE